MSAVLSPSSPSLPSLSRHSDPYRNAYDCPHVSHQAKGLSMLIDTGLVAVDALVDVVSSCRAGRGAGIAIMPSALLPLMAI